MRERELATGLALTEIGFGAAQLGNLYREVSDAEASDAVDAAWQSGIRYFDTAPHYGIGLSERRLGAALARRPRAEYVLSTKVGRALVPSPETAHEQDAHGFVTPATHRREWDFSRDGVLRSLEGSLERLGTDRVDVVYLHDPDDHLDEAIAEAAPALIALREEGVIGAVGAGMTSAPALTRLVRELDLDVIMVAGRYTLLDRAAEQELLPLALERGVAVVAAAVYNSGLLATHDVPADAKFDYGQAPIELLARARALAALAEREGVTLPDLAVQFALRHPAVVSVVVGTRTRAQVESTIERYEAVVPEALWAEIG